MKKKDIIKALRKHLKTKEHRRKDLDCYIDKKLKKIFIYNNGWGASQEKGFEEAISVLKKLKF